MMEANPYKAYSDDSILNSSPLELVVALYEGAIQASVKARECLANKDIPGRAHQIKKIVNILTELMLRLDDQKGGDFARNLRNLYIYVQSRVLEANVKQIAEPLQEIEKLLGTVLEGWREVCHKAPVHSHSREEVFCAGNKAEPVGVQGETAGFPYGFSYGESGATSSPYYAF